MNALFLKDLAQKTRRGLRGRIEAGKSAGGKCYGHDVVRQTDERGEPIRGGRAINLGTTLAATRRDARASAAIHKAFAGKSSTR